METEIEIVIGLIILIVIQRILLLFKWKIIFPIRNLYQKSFDYDGFHENYNNKLTSNYPFKQSGYKSPDIFMPDYFISFLIFGFISSFSASCILGLFLINYQLNIISVLISAPFILLFPKTIISWNFDWSHLWFSILIGNFVGLTSGYYILPAKYVILFGTNIKPVFILIKSSLYNFPSWFGHFSNILLEIIIGVILLLLIQKILLMFKNVTIWPLHKIGCRLFDSEYGKPNNVTTFNDGSYFIEERGGKGGVEEGGYFIAYFVFGIFSVLITGFLVSIIFNGYKLNFLSVILCCLLFILLSNSFFKLRYWVSYRKPILNGTLTGLILGYLLYYVFS